MTDPGKGSEVPDAGPVEEAGDDAVLADLEDGAEVAGDECGGGPGPFGGGGTGGERRGVVAEDRPEGEQPAGSIGRQGAIEAGQGFEDAGVELRHVPVAREVVQGTLGGGLADRVMTPGGREDVVGRDQPADGGLRVGDHDEEAAVATLGEVERGLEEDAGQDRVGDGVFPDRELRRRVEDPPPAVREGERLLAAGEQLDLVVRAQDQADVAAGAGGPRVGDVGPGAGDVRPPRAGELARPPLDLDDLGELALPIDEEERPRAVAEPMDALEARQLDAVGEGVGGRPGERAGRIRRPARAGGRRWRPAGSRRSRVRRCARSGSWRRSG